MRSNRIAEKHPSHPILLFILIMGMVINTSCQPRNTPPHTQISSPTTSQTSTASEPKPSNTPRSPKPTLTLTLPPSVTPTPNPQVKPLNFSGTHISFWHPWSGALADQVAALVMEFNQKNEWGIKVDVTAPGSSGELFAQVVSNTSNSQALPSIIALSSEYLSTLQEKYNIIIDANDYIRDADYGLSAKEIADTPLLFWEQDKINNQQLGIPAQRTMHVLFYNQSWANELGFSDPPTNPEEFKTQACSAAKANLRDKTHENDGTGGWIISTDSLDLVSWMLLYGDDGLPKDETQPYQFNNTTWLNTFTFLRQLVDEQCAWTSSDAQPYGYFANRQALFYSGTLQDIPHQEEALKRLNNNDRWILLQYPAGQKKPVTLVTGPSYAILKSNPQEQFTAWLFIHWLISPLNQAKLIQDSSTIPTSNSTLEYLDTYSENHTQWKQALMWTPLATPAPRWASWITVRNILEDAAWQIYQPQTKVSQIPTILKELDSTILEMFQRPTSDLYGILDENLQQRYTDFQWIIVTIQPG